MAEPGNPERPSSPEPLSNDTKEQFVAEIFGTLERSSHVAMEHEAEKVDVDIFNSLEDTVIISREIEGGTSETRFDVIGSGRDAEVFVIESVTVSGSEGTARESDHLQEELGMGRRPATENEVAEALRQIREAEEVGRSEE